MLGLQRLSVYYKDKAFLYKEVVSLKRNAFFGELALIKNDPRAATILAKIPTHT